MVYLTDWLFSVVVVAVVDCWFTCLCVVLLRCALVGVGVEVVVVGDATGDD